MNTLRDSIFLLSLLAAEVGIAGPATAEIHGELAHCAALTDPEVRLRCYDLLAARSPPPAASQGDRIGVAPPEPEVARQGQGHQAEQIADRGAEASDLERGRWLGIRPYRRNYILPVTYNSRLNGGRLQESTGGFDPEDVEVKFQLSFELPVWERILGQDLDLYFAYTQLSFFQAYNTEYSSPFRDTSYEPELGLNWQPDLELLGWRLNSARLALNHQSNGRTEPLSRSWNRLIGQFRVKHGNLGLGVRLWTRFQEDAEDDDNPDITDFMGHGELFVGYDRGRHRFGLMVRNPREHAGLQLDWSYLLSDRVRFYLQYFNGFGESLIDYDRQVNRIGMGFLLNEWP
jgi:phospholipase A1